ncbi:hypothetical protein [Priestia filamentosa]|uniref:Uncharacterized protein n=1 Tax=Priestia filamentosa TaxID=1402861 RepID=A0A1X7CQ16_9BACI|nr:hypothetical protein [Priestia filamentosa]AKO94453.1 hypothetical protein BEH_21530 [Priestia filamentosa]MDT3764748.1 hypothetical protein [Priestia filamentosa]OXS70810.1 hypothetical protein B1B01_00420 [Priestia filamentosa]RJS66441.1 hypothetical protein CJ485_17750 [Priestia filamentosa]WCM15349.1 hypothetical protein PGN40_18735 [Priestia filamentosa]
MQELYSEAKISIKTSEYLNLPNIHFYNWCYQRYGLNRGTFNTIEDWLYNHGVINVLSRRIYLLAFLNYLEEKGIKKGSTKYLKFGQGGLARKFHDFLNILEENPLSKY